MGLIINKMEETVYIGMLRECWKWMKKVKPSNQIWYNNALSVHHYCKKLKELRSAR